MKTFSKIILGILMLLVIIIGGAAVYLTTQFDPNAYSAQIASKVSETLGRKLTINGPVAFTVFPSIKLSLADVTLGNADWAGAMPMASVKNMDASLALMPLLSRQIIIEDIELKGVALNLAQSAGRNNWTFASAKSAEKPGSHLQQKDASSLSLEILSLAVSDTTLNYNADGKATKLRIDHAKISLQPTNPLALTADGQINGAPFSADIRGDKFAGILSNSNNWPVNGTVKLAGTTVKFDGALHQPQKSGGAEFQVSVDGSGVDAVPLTGSPLPFGKYDLKAKLTLAGMQSATLSGIDFSTGHTKGAGELRITTSGRLYANGTLNISTLDLADFSGAPQPVQQGSLLIPSVFAADAAGLIIPEIPLPTAALRMADANIKFNIGSITQNGNKIASTDGTINLQNGNLHVAPFKLTYSGNVFDGDINIDGRGSATLLTANITSPQLDYGTLLSELKMTNRIQGIGALSLNLEGTGNNLRQVVANSHGKFLLTSNQGSFDTGVLFDNVGGIISAVLPNMNIPKTAKLNCAVFDFTGAGGVWSTTQSAVDADRLTLTLVGDVNLGNEALNLKAAPTIKNTKYGSVIPTLKIAGFLAHPNVTSDGSSMVQNALTAGALAKVKGLDILSGIMKPRTSTPLGAAGNACMAAVQKSTTSGQPASAAPTSSATAQPAGNKQQLNDVINKGLQGLFGK